MSAVQDATLTGKIKAALLLDERIGATGINVTTVNEEVTLEGNVDTEVQRRLAEEIATRNGATAVKNELAVTGDRVAAPQSPIADGAFGTVTTPEGAPPAERKDLKEEVRRALAADKRVNAYTLIIDVDDHAVRLTGRQDTVDARDAAVETASHVPGVVAVEEDVEIMPAV